MNPYFIAWCRAHSHNPDDLSKNNRALGKEPTRVVDPHDGKRRPWTVVFMLWIQAKWREWATEKGFRGDHRAARLSGHTDFGAWLDRSTRTIGLEEEEETKR